MKVGIIQSNYIPWRGYFDFIASVDLFIFHDDLQYTKGDWRNRNLIKTANGLKWVTVPVKHHSSSQLIIDTAIDYSQPWQRSHLNRFYGSYSAAPYVKDAISILENSFLHNDVTISQLNRRIISDICCYLGIETKLAVSSDYDLSGSKTDRLIALLNKVNAQRYLSGPAAKAYLQEDAFNKAGIGLSYKTYDYDDYPQLFGEFESAVTALDLIANCGPQSVRFIRSTTPEIIRF